MSTYMVTDESLIDIADAIRTKGGTAASLVFPNGFVSAINDIQTGRGISQEKVTATVKGRAEQVILPSIGNLPQAVVVDINGGKVPWQ